MAPHAAHERRHSPKSARRASKPASLPGFQTASDQGPCPSTSAASGPGTPPCSSTARVPPRQSPPAIAGSKWAALLLVTKELRAGLPGTFTAAPCTQQCAPIASTAGHRSLPPAAAAQAPRRRSPPPAAAHAAATRAPALRCVNLKHPMKAQHRVLHQALPSVWERCSAGSGNLHAQTVLLRQKLAAMEAVHVGGVEQLQGRVATPPASTSQAAWLSCSSGDTTTWGRPAAPAPAPAPTPSSGARAMSSPQLSSAHSGSIGSRLRQAVVAWQVQQLLAGLPAEDRLELQSARSFLAQF